jgi:hypothetical protein
MKTRLGAANRHADAKKHGVEMAMFMTFWDDAACRRDSVEVATLRRRGFTPAQNRVFFF